MTCKIEMNVDGDKHVFEDESGDEDFDNSAEEQASHFLIENGSSVFFPTFRRIEGGFSIETLKQGKMGNRLMRPRTDIEEALLVLSRRLTNSPHVFVSSISTVDIVSLLLRKHADLAEVYNSLQQATSQKIIGKIKTYKDDPKDVTEAGAIQNGDIDMAKSVINSANSVLDEIRFMIESMEDEREKIMKPIEAVRELVEQLFKHTGIHIDSRLSFGDAANAVNSDSLSAGEKQMLSFI